MRIKWKAVVLSAGGARFGYADKDESTADHDFHMVNGQLSYALSSKHSIGVKAHHWQKFRASSFTTAPGEFANKQEIIKDSAHLFWQFQSKQGSRAYIGGEHARQKVDSSVAQVLDMNGNVVAESDNKEQGYERDMSTVMFQGRWVTPLEGFETELGVRHDYYSDFGNQLSPRLAAIYHLNDNQTLKFIYANAFRAPVTLEILGSNFIKGSDDIKPEELDSYELVWLHQMARWAYQLTGYHSIWRNGIVSERITDPDYISQYTNAGKNSSYGVEAEVKFQHEKWLMQFNAGYSQSKNEIDNTDYVMFPAFNSNLEVTYHFLKEHSLRGMIWYKDGWHATESETSETLSAYKRVDIAYQYQVLDSLTLNAVIKNITDQENYIPSLFNRSQGELEPLPRQFDVNLTWQL